MAHSERTRPSRNGTASLGQRAVSPQPPSALWQIQLASPDQAEFALCEQTILAMSSPMVVGTALALLFMVDGPFRSMRSTAPSLAHRCRSGAVHTIREGEARIARQERIIAEMARDDH